MNEPRRGREDDGDFITFQEAKRELGVFPSTIRTWLRDGLIAAGEIDNFRVSRGALKRSIAATEDGASTSADPPSGDAETALARRIVEICRSAGTSADKLTLLEAEASSILNRLP